MSDFQLITLVLTCFASTSVMMLLHKLGVYRFAWEDYHHPAYRSYRISAALSTTMFFLAPIWIVLMLIAIVGSLAGSILFRLTISENVHQ